MWTPTVDPKPKAAKGPVQVSRRAIRGDSGVAGWFTPAWRIGNIANARLEGNRGIGPNGHLERQHGTICRTVTASTEAIVMMNKKKLSEIKAEVAAILDG